MIKYQNLNSRPFRKFLDDCSRSPECRNLDLPGFLIKPVQRICKYPLLIKVRQTSHMGAIAHYQLAARLYLSR